MTKKRAGVTISATRISCLAANWTIAIHARLHANPTTTPIAMNGHASCAASSTASFTASLTVSLLCPISPARASATSSGVYEAASKPTSARCNSQTNAQTPSRQRAQPHLRSSDMAIEWYGSSSAMEARRAPEAPGEAPGEAAGTQAILKVFFLYNIFMFLAYRPM
jgi:hypothetical protein